ncbi:hypothetical protein L5515_006773 [Caenorhabditis briggsae]|nr:hypothetical protein L5515_006773 [Caenorhabditis briggsae]
MYIKSQRVLEDEVIESLGKLNPTDVELCFTFSQTCFQYAGNRFQKDILKIMDHFQQVLSEDLHFYYTEKMRNSRYAKRLAELLKVNNTMQKSIWKSRPLLDLNRVFNVVKVGFSHPQMFEDSAFCTGFEN